MCSLGGKKAFVGALACCACGRAKLLSWAVILGCRLGAVLVYDALYVGLGWGGFAVRISYENTLWGRSVTIRDVVMLLALLLLGYFWWIQDQYRRRAFGLAKQACDRAGVQLLDDSVGLKRVRLRRVRGGFLLERQFSFEFTPSGAARFAGSVVFAGARVQAVDLDLSQPIFGI